MLATRNRIAPWPMVSSGIWRDSNGAEGHSGWTPAASVVETDDAFMLYLEVPGVTPDSIAVDLNGEHLVVSGERAPFTPSEDGRVISSEMAWGRFVRRFRVGSGVDRENVSATYQNGILAIEAQKSTEARPRRIPVTVSD